MVAQQSSVLVVEDELLLRTMLRTSLSAGAFAVEEAHSGEEALDRAQQASFDLVLLDADMPGIGGVEACRRLKNRSPRTGIVAMVTEHDLSGDEIQVLEAGADDYVTKPFGVRELIARLRGVMRRTRAMEMRAMDSQTPGLEKKHSWQDASKPQVLQAGALKLDLDRRVVMRAGNQVHLSPKEFDLLTFMMQHEGAPVTHSELLCSVWGAESVGMVEYLRSYVYNLRKKIEIDPAMPDYILTIPWIGYRFRNPDDLRS